MLNIFEAVEHGFKLTKISGCGFPANANMVYELIQFWCFGITIGRIPVAVDNLLSALNVVWADDFLVLGITKGRIPVDNLITVTTINQFSTDPYVSLNIWISYDCLIVILILHEFMNKTCYHNASLEYWNTEFELRLPNFKFNRFEF